MDLQTLHTETECLSAQTDWLHRELDDVGQSALRRLNPSAHSSAERISQSSEQLKAVLDDTEQFTARLQQHRADISESISMKNVEIGLLVNEQKMAVEPQKIDEITKKLDQLQKEKKQLTRMQARTDRMLDRIQAKSDGAKQIVHSLNVRQMQYTQHTGTKGTIVGAVVKAPLKLGANIAKSAGKQLESGLNPLAKNINKQDTADHGMESLRLAYHTGKKVERTAKSAAGTVKAAKSTAKTAAKATEKTVKFAIKTAYRVTVTVAKVTETVVVHTVAVIMNPFVLFLVLVCVIMILGVSLLVQAMNINSAGAAGTTAAAYTDAIGAGNIAEKYPEAANFYRIACENNKAAFSADLNALYFSNTDLRGSDLLYMQHDLDGAITEYTKGYATDVWKTECADAWSILVDEQQAIAIAYVYLEIQENEAHGTEQVIYEVTFTQEVFNEIVNTSVKWIDTPTRGQACVEGNCSRHTTTRPNPAYTEAVAAYNLAVQKYNDWEDIVIPYSNEYVYALDHLAGIPPIAGRPYDNAVDRLQAAESDFIDALNEFAAIYGGRFTVSGTLGVYYEQVLSDEWDEAEEVMNNTPRNIEGEPAYVCDHQHTLHSFGLYTYNADLVMNTLGFTDAYKEWESLTEMGLTDMAVTDAEETETEEE